MLLLQSMLMPILEEHQLGDNSETLMKSISSRIAGGQIELNLKPSQVSTIEVL
jgi:hypothetical protein